MSSQIDLVVNKRLPRQACSTTAYTTAQQSVKLIQTPELEAFRDKNSKRPATPDPAYLEPENSQTILVYDAWKQQSVVTVLRKRGELRNLLNGEEAELKCQAGIPGFEKLDANAAEPREFALTLLIFDISACPNKQILLDAMALLARDGGTARAAKTARLTVLYNEDAVGYNRQRGGRVQDSGVQLALSHVNDAGALSTIKTPLAYKDSGRKVWKVLMTAISQLFKDVRKLVPECLIPSRDVGSADVTNAFAAAELEANKEFWQLLSTHERPPSIGYALTQPQGDDDRIFVKMVPHHVMSTPEGLAHKDVSFGALFYKNGMYEETKEFVAKVREEQRAVETEKNGGVFPPEDWPWGLRPNDQTQKEQALGLHVAWVKCDLVSFRGMLSCFGLEGAPGERVCVNDESFMPRLNYYLQPLDAQMCRHYFVLPTNRECVDVLDDRLVRAQWMVTSRGFEAHYGQCTADPPIPDKDLTPKSPRHGFQLPRFVDPPSDEDATLSKMIGIPISSAFRIGDLYEEVEKSDQALPEFSSFLMCCSARWSPTASMSSAFRGWVEIEQAHKAELEARNVRIRELESAASSAPPVAPPADDVGPFEYGVITSVLRGARRKKSSTACVLRLPMEKGRILGISNTLAKALSRDPWTKTDEDVKWGMANCGDMTQLEAIVAIANRLITLPIVIVVIADGHVGKFLLVQPKGRDADATQEYVSIADVLRLRTTGKAVFLQYTETEMKLFALVIDAEQ
jgi:hypothetical protein